MNHFTNQSNGSHRGHSLMGRAMIRRFALFPMMLLMLLLLPAGMAAQKAASSSKYIATYESSTQTLTFKKFVGETLPENSAWVEDKMTVMDMNKNLGNDLIVNIVFDKSFSTYTPTSLYEFFFDIRYLKTIKGLEYLNTERVTNMSKMFYGCSFLTSLDITKLNTTNVTNMSFMFSGCSKLTSLDVTHFNTANVTDMSSMFYGCSSLTSLDVTKFNTTNVTNMDSMFYGCSSLTSLDVTKFNTTNVTNMGKMFYGCSSLTSLDVTKFNTTNVTYMSFMFSGCSKLTSLDVTKFNTTNVTDMSCMFYGCSSLTSLDVTHFNTANVTDMRGMFGNCVALTSLDLTNFNTTNVTDMYCMFSGCSSLTSLDLTNFNTANVRSMSFMFSECHELTTIYASSKFVTTHINFSGSMFDKCEKLKGEEVWTEDKATDKTYAKIEGGYFTSRDAYPRVKYADRTLTFYNSSETLGENEYKLNRSTELPAWLAYKDSITQVVFDASFAEARPTTCRAWFKDCINLEKIEGIKYLNTSEVTDMGSMFERCFKLQTIDLSGFDTRKVTNMYGMFTACIKLTSLDISNFNTSEVKNMESMFHDCRKLTSLDFSHFNTANVTNMTSMFNSCTNLSSVDLSGFDTRNVKEMSNMFSYCQSLKILDLSSFNTLEKAKDSYMGDMFEACRELTTIFVSDKFVIGKSSSMMFDRCLKLKGAIAYDKTKTESGYANYKTGYFTKLVGKNGDEKIGAAGETLTADTLTLADDKDFVAYEPFAAKAASYSRKMSAGTTWATLCLPFEVSLQNQNFRAFQLLSSSDDVVELQEMENSIAAGTPVIIKMNEGATTLTFSETDKAIEPAVAAGSSTENGKYQLVGLYQKKMFSRDADNHSYILKGGNLMNPAKILLGTSTSTVGSLPYRAYMLEKASEGGAARMFSIRIGDGTTAIKQLEADTADAADSKAEYYDLQGHRLQDLQKGVNIVKRGGKTMKVIIK